MADPVLRINKAVYDYLKLKTNRPFKTKSEIESITIHLKNGHQYCFNVEVI